MTISITSVNGGVAIKPGDTIAIAGTGFGTEKGEVKLSFNADTPQEWSFFDDDPSLLTWTNTNISFQSRAIKQWRLPLSGDGSIFFSLAIVVVRVDGSGSEIERGSLAVTINPPSGYAVVDIPDTFSYTEDQIMSHVGEGYGVGNPFQVVYQTTSDQGSPVSITGDGVLTIQTPNDVEQFEFGFQPSYFFPSGFTWRKATQNQRSLPVAIEYHLAPNPLLNYTSQNGQLFGLLRGQVVNQLECKVVS